MPTSSVVPPRWSAPLRSQFGEQKNQSAPFSRPGQQIKKIKKIVAQWVPSSVPFGDCEKRTVTRFALSFAFRLISLAQGLPFSTIYAFAFLFFSSPSDWQKIFSSPVKIFLSLAHFFFCHAWNSKFVFYCKNLYDMLVLLKYSIISFGKFFLKSFLSNSIAK